MPPTFDPIRPMLALANHLSARSGVVITYEDPALPLASSSSDAAGLLSPPAIQHALAVETVNDPLTLLRNAADEWSRLGLPGQFKVFEGGPSIHVVGRPGPFTTDSPSKSALLDREISMPAFAGTGRDFVAALVESLGGAGVLGVGSVPFNVLEQHRERWEAQRREARAVLRDFVSSVGVRMGWALLYDPMAGKFTLNLG